MKQSYIEYKNVSKSFGDTNVLRDINLSVAQGEFFVLLGSSGCGKTTLIRLLAGFEQPTEGAVYLDGNDITHKNPNQRPVNMMFQNYAVFPTMSVYDNVAYGLKKAKKDKAFIREEVAKVLEMVKLDHLSHRMPDRLSGGQIQRVALARAIVLKPKVLLLDEPLSALDANLRADLRSELVNLHKQLGITFIMVTHDRGEALAMADRIGIIHDNTIIQTGTPEEIYQNPNCKYVANFMGRANFFNVTVTENTKTKMTVNINGVFDVELKGKNKLPVQKGDSGHLMIRPENMQVTRTPQKKDFCLTGHVHEIAYQGRETVITGISKSGATITAVVQNSIIEGTQDYKIGEQIYISWNMESVYMIQE